MRTTKSVVVLRTDEMKIPSGRENKREAMSKLPIDETILAMWQRHNSSMGVYQRITRMSKQATSLILKMSRLRGEARISHRRGKIPVTGHNCWLPNPLFDANLALILSRNTSSAKKYTTHTMPQSAKRPPFCTWLTGLNSLLMSLAALVVIMDDFCAPLWHSLRRSRTIQVPVLSLDCQSGFVPFPQGDLR